MAPDIGLGNWFRQRALRTPERRALRFEGRDWTYADMQLEIEACAERLAALGVEKGDRVAFLGLNQPMFFFVMFGCARIGAIFVPLNFRLTGPELAFMIQDCAVRALIVDAQLRPIIEPQLRQSVVVADRPRRRGRSALDAGGGARRRTRPRPRG